MSALGLLRAVRDRLVAAWLWLRDPSGDASRPTRWAVIVVDTEGRHLMAVNGFIVADEVEAVALRDALREAVTGTQAMVFAVRLRRPEPLF